MGRDTGTYESERMDAMSKPNQMEKATDIICPLCKDNAKHIPPYKAAVSFTIPYIYCKCGFRCMGSIQDQKKGPRPSPTLELEREYAVKANDALLDRAPGWKRR